MHTPLFALRHLPRLVHWSRRLRGANYEREMDLLDVLCDPARRGVDIGAKIGMYTYRIRKHCTAVLAFEPIPLFNNLLRAVFEGKRAHVEPYAVSDVQGRVTMRLPYNHDGSRQFGRSTIEPANPLVHQQIARIEEIEVETRRLDDYDLTDIGFIKIDVEGHELAVLAGAEKTILANRPVLLIECNDEHRPGATRDLAAWLRAHDYDGWFRLDGALCSIHDHDPATHGKRGLENFMCIPVARVDIRERLAARVR